MSSLRSLSKMVCEGFVSCLTCFAFPLSMLQMSWLRETEQTGYISIIGFMYIFNFNHEISLLTFNFPFFGIPSGPVAVFMSILGAFSTAESQRD